MSKTNGTAAAGRPKPALVRSEHAKTWHIDDGTAPDGSERRKTPVRRVFSADYKLSILLSTTPAPKPARRAPCCAARACTRAC